MGVELFSLILLPLFCVTDLSAMDIAQQSVDLHPNGSDRSVGVLMEQMELSSGEVREQPAAMYQSPADEAMDQCMICAVCNVIVRLLMLFFLWLNQVWLGPPKENLSKEIDTGFYRLDALPVSFIS